MKNKIPKYLKEKYRTKQIRTFTYKMLRLKDNLKSAGYNRVKIY